MATSVSADTPSYLKPTRWQLLPDSVNRAFVGPDQRVWLVHNEHRSVTPADARVQIEREFSKREPNLTAIRPALFEPTGRIWFEVDGQLLLGYDGRTWTEVSGQSKSSWKGVCPNHYHSILDTTPNLYVAGTAFFADGQGVTTVTGAKAGYQDTPAEGGGNNTAPFLMPEQDGRGVLAMTMGTQFRVWRWRAGLWSEVKLPAAKNLWPPDRPSMVPLAEQGRSGILIFWSNNNAQWIPLDPEKPSPPPAAAPAPAPDRATPGSLIPKLGAAEFAEREAASKTLVELGPAILPQLSKVLADTRDPEIQFRLEAIIERLKAEAAPPPATAVTPEPVLTVAGHRLRLPSLATYAPLTRTLFLRAEQIDDGGAGLLAVPADGAARVLKDPGKGTTWLWTENWLPPVFAVPDRQVWLPGQDDFPARLWDLERGTFTDALPAANDRYVQAALTNGIVFFHGTNARHNPFQAGPVTAWNPNWPNAPDTRTLEHVAVKRSGGAEYIGTADGRLWVTREDGSLQTYDGTKWETVPDLDPGTRIISLTPGTGNVLLVQMKDQWCLITTNAVRRTDALLDLLKQERAVVTNDMFFVTYPRDVSVVSDAGGALWCLNDGKLNALIGDEWRDIRPVLQEAGFGSSPKVRHLAPIGRGEAVYVASDSKAVFATVRNGAVRLSEAPAASRSQAARRTVFDPVGVLWVPGYTSVAIAYRISATNQVETVRDVGWPVLTDLAGNEWLHKPFTVSTDGYWVWHSGLEPFRVNIPGSRSGCLLAADAPGSMYAWTAAGLFHFKVPAGAPANRYDLHRHMQLANVAGWPQQMVASSRGFLALQTTPRNGGPKEARVYFFPTR